MRLKGASEDGLPVEVTLGEIALSTIVRAVKESKVERIRDLLKSDYQGRDLTVEAELALDKDGNFLAVRGSNLSNLGGHAVAFVFLQKELGLMSNVYRIRSAISAVAAP
jgi:aerobic carbon-monoxide dehydrogenase large subunit